MNKKQIAYSVIIPVFNEENNVRNLHVELVTVLNTLKKPYEIIFVDDGSTDNTNRAILKLSPAILIKLRKNSGQSAALDAGIKHSQGSVIITLDGDGQNDPRDIPAMIQLLKKNNDVVCGWRVNRKDPFSKRFVSYIARLFRKIIVNDSTSDAVCGLRVYKRECFESLDLYGEMHRMIPARLSWQGFKVVEIPVNHRPRKFGTTKYNWKRTIKGFLDMISVWFMQKFDGRPLHLFGTFGLLLISFSSLLLSFLFVLRLFFGYLLSDKIWPMVGMMTLLLGFQFLVFGLLADLIIRSSERKKFYLIENITER